MRTTTSITRLKQCKYEQIYSNTFNTSVDDTANVVHLFVDPHAMTCIINYGILEEYVKNTFRSKSVVLVNSVDQCDVYAYDTTRPNEFPKSRTIDIPKLAYKPSEYAMVDIYRELNDRSRVFVERVCKRYDIYSTNQFLTRFSLCEIREAPGIGPKTYQELRKALAKRDLYFVKAF